MSYPHIYLCIIILASVFVGVLFVLFGQITVRKLRKNSRGGKYLGLELVSGWDILNVAGALSTPSWLRKKFESSRVSGLSANYIFLYENTNKFDRLLARLFWYLYIITGLAIISYTVASVLGSLS